MDREKVINKVKAIVADMQEEVDEWKDYSDSELRGGLTCDCDWWYKTLQTLKDALALLKAQEPRVMTLYEVAKMAADFQDSMLWFEPKEVDDEMWFMAYAQPVESDETDIHVYEFGNEQPIEAKKYLYGKTWRCWTSCPTDEQREKVKWE